MKLDRFRAPALAATAVLLISGVASTFAASPAPVAPAPVAPAPVVQAEPAGPDSDTLQVGDQTTPDAAGAAESATEPAPGAEAEKGSTETTGAESDGPGGHADADGQNVDHQFDGEE